jgi:8-oxo-dGTP diphosphatase
MNERPKVGVACFVWREGKFLIGKRIGAHGLDTWSVPGGHLEHGESWEEAAKREVMEESGMEIENIRFLAATNDVFESGKHYISLWLEADWKANEPSITEPDIWIDQAWCDFNSLPTPLFEPCWQNLRAAKPELFNETGQ